MTTPHDEPDADHARAPRPGGPDAADDAPSSAAGRSASSPGDGEPAPPDRDAAGASGQPRPEADIPDELPDDEWEIKALAERLDRLHDRLGARTHAEVHGLFEILGSKRRLLFVNFTAGLARGAGFFLGVTLVGGLIIGAVAFSVDTTARAMGFEDVTFRSLVQIFAKKAAEAQEVWEDVRETGGSAGDGAPGKDPDGDAADRGEDDGATPPPPRDN